MNDNNDINEVFVEEDNAVNNTIQEENIEGNGELIIEEDKVQQNYQSIENAENFDSSIRVEISKIGYVMFIIFGLTMLCAWNLWITAVPFFKNRLSGTIFQDNFQNYISIVFMFTNTLSSFIILKIQQKN